MGAWTPGRTGSEEAFGGLGTWALGRPDGRGRRRGGRVESLPFAHYNFIVSCAVKPNVVYIA